MGLSSLPAPSDGVLTLLLVNTALSISFFKEIVRSILHTLGLDRYSPCTSAADPDDLSSLSSTAAAAASLSTPPPRDAADSVSHRFKSQFKPVRFGQRKDKEHPVLHSDCRVCLSRFEPDSVVNRLPCGHFFHAVCLEKWLGYHHVTCPLCRTRVLPAGDSGVDDDCGSASSWPWF